MFGRKKKGHVIAAETVRYEIAWTIPRAKFMNPSDPSSPDAPWWADERFPKENLAGPRFRELETFVTENGGEIAMYAVTYTAGEEAILEKLVRYVGSGKAPLRKAALPVAPAVKAALGELEAMQKKKAAAAEASAARSAPKKPASRRPGGKPSGKSAGKPGGSSAGWLMRGSLVAAAIALGTVAWTATAEMRAARAAPVADLQPAVPADYYVSQFLQSVPGTAECELSRFDNRTGASTYLGRRPCAEVQAEQAAKEQAFKASKPKPAAHKG